LIAANPAKTATDPSAMVRADKPRLEAARIHSPFSAQPNDGRCDRSGRQSAERLSPSLRENSVEQPAFQAAVNFRVRPEHDLFRLFGIMLV
jgi:hypothetical protein